MANDMQMLAGHSELLSQLPQGKVAELWDNERDPVWSKWCEPPQPGAESQTRLLKTRLVASVAILAIFFYLAIFPTNRENVHYEIEAIVSSSGFIPETT